MTSCWTVVKRPADSPPKPVYEEDRQQEVGKIVAYPVREVRRFVGQHRRPIGSALLEMPLQNPGLFSDATFFAHVGSVHNRYDMS
jgi:hypothetical protein